MRLDFSDERVLAVVAHPDDAELLCAGTLARAKADGAPVGLCVMCRGDKGQPEPPVDDLADIRRAELAASARLLDAHLFQCGIGDGELHDTAAARQQLIEVYRQFRPSLVLAHSSLDYHADHRATATLAEAASWFCASAGHTTESPPLSAPPTLWWMDTVEMIGFVPEIYIDVSDNMELKSEMIQCHASQLARGENADFSPLERLMIRQAEARGAQAGVRAAEGFRPHAAWKRIRAW